MRYITVCSGQTIYKTGQITIILDLKCAYISFRGPNDANGLSTSRYGDEAYIFIVFDVVTEGFSVSMCV